VSNALDGASQFEPTNCDNADPFNNRVPPRQIEIEKDDDEDWPFVYVSIFMEDVGIAEAIIIDSFVLEDGSPKIDTFELGRP
jgi:hypothetical protein